MFCSPPPASHLSARILADSILIALNVFATSPTQFPVTLYRRFGVQDLRLPAFHRRRDAISDGISRALQRVRIFLDIASGHCQRLVSKQIADKEGIEAGLAAVGADCVPEIVQPRVLEFRRLPNATPR